MRAQLCAENDYQIDGGLPQCVYEFCCHWYLHRVFAVALKSGRKQKEKGKTNIVGNFTWKNPWCENIYASWDAVNLVNCYDMTAHRIFRFQMSFDLNIFLFLLTNFNNRSKHFFFSFNKKWKINLYKAFYFHP